LVAPYFLFHKVLDGSNDGQVYDRGENSVLKQLADWAQEKT
jgi:hypothetical protein